MSTEVQRLMVIHDASRNDGLSAIISSFESLPVRSGDELTLLGVINKHPSPLKIKSLMDGSGSHAKSKDDEQMRKDEYLKREDVIRLSTICIKKKVSFCIDVQTGSSPRKVAAKAAKSSSMTWVVLDRQMKKDKRYFMEKLTCGILTMKRNDTIEKLRGPIMTDDKKQKVVRRSISSEHFSYGEMIPVMSKQEVSPKKTSNTQKTTSLHKTEGGNSYYRSSASVVSTSSFTSFEVSSYPSSASMSSSSSFTTYDVSSATDARNYPTMNFQQDENDSKNIQPKDHIPKRKDKTAPFEEQDKQQCKLSDTLAEEVTFEYSVCSVCENKRPNIRLKQDFTYTELQQATNGFATDNFLSEGGFGSVYEGKLKCGLKVAIKQHKDASFQGEKEFKSEVNVLSKARHPNLVMLLGSCSEGTHRLLVYEFVCNGSLDQHLSSHELTWDKRIKIALGAARGLDYLHSKNIIHRDMRPNNILVTHDYEPLLGDFGLARTVCVDTDETGVVGTLGYVAPEYAEYGKVSKKTDVYSFGVVLLQLITGCKTKEDKFEDKTLVEWVRRQAIT